MSKQKAAEYISYLFKKSYAKPEDILKAFRPALRRIILYLEKEPLSMENTEAKLEQLAAEIWGRMGHISVDIIRCRVTDEMMLRFYELDNGLISAGKTRHFKDINTDLMKALISMVYAEKKQGQKSAPKIVRNPMPGFAVSG